MSLSSRLARLASTASTFALATASAVSGAAPTPVAINDDLRLTRAAVWSHDATDTVIFELEVQGTAGATRPRPAGGMDGAPVLAYVFATTLEPQQVGFAPIEGTLALVATSHPDFDDTPLWDEDGDGDPTNAAEGAIFHSHWVVLVPDDRVSGGLAVRPVTGDPATVLPPTAPGMPIFLDSPGFPVVLRDGQLRIPVPAGRIRDLGTFRYDAVTAYLQVNGSDDGRPTLGVYQVYSVLSGDLSLPYSFTR